jgi:hypothetical protein
MARRLASRPAVIVAIIVLLFLAFLAWVGYYTYIPSDVRAAYASVEVDSTVIDPDAWHKTSTFPVLSREGLVLRRSEGSSLPDFSSWMPVHYGSFVIVLYFDLETKIVKEKHLYSRRSAPDWLP